MDIEEILQKLYKIYKDTDDKGKIYDELIKLQYSETLPEKEFKNSYSGKLYEKHEKLEEKLVAEFITKACRNSLDKIMAEARYNGYEDYNYSWLNDINYLDFKQLPKLNNKKDYSKSDNNFYYFPHSISPHFIKHELPFHRSNDGLNHYLNLKIYFTIDPNEYEKFMLDFNDFCIENQINTFYKSRPILANDMVTIRFDSFSDLDKIINFVQKYKIDYQNNPFINQYKGVGLTIDENSSYNSFITDLIYDYFKDSKSINKNDFLNYLKEYKKNIQIPSYSDYFKDKNENKKNYIFFMNLENIINNEKFDFEKFKKTVITESDRLNIESEKSNLRSKIANIGKDYIYSLVDETINYVIKVDGDENLIKTIIHNILNNPKPVYKNENVEFSVNDVLTYSLYAMNLYLHEENVEDYLTKQIINRINYKRKQSKKNKK